MIAVTRENSRAVVGWYTQQTDFSLVVAIYSIHMCMRHCSLSLHHFDVDIKLKAQAIIITLPSGFQSMPVSRDRKAYSLKVSGLISDVKINGTYFLT